MNSCTYNLRPANPYYQNMVDKITAKLNMPPIEVYQADTANACATMYKSEIGQKPIITYNASFINRLQNLNIWAVYFVFAHEVAHHYNKDLHGQFLSRLRGYNKVSHRKELNADYFAGWVLRCEGARYSDASSFYDALPLHHSDSHPAGYLRKQAMTKGWNDANCKYAPPKRVVQVQQTDWGSLFVALGLVVVAGVGITALSKSK